MTKSFMYPILPTIFIILLVLSISINPTNSQEFSTKLSKKELGQKEEKQTHLHFYFHDIVSGENQTAFQVAQAATTNKSKTGFGNVVIIDDPLTVSPDLGSKLVGRAQGIYASASMNDLGFLMAMNYVFVEGEYNGSTLSILGRNAVMSGVREMPLVGGSGFSGLLVGMLRRRLILLIPRLLLLSIMFMSSIIEHCNEFL